MDTNSNSTCRASSREAVCSMPFHRRGENLAGINSRFLDTAASLFPLAYDDIFGQSHLRHSALKALYKGYCITILSWV